MISIKDDKTEKIVTEVEKIVIGGKFRPFALIVASEAWDAGYANALSSAGWVKIEYGNRKSLPKKKGEYWWTHENGHVARFEYESKELRPILTKRYVAWMPSFKPEPFTEGKEETP